MHVHGKHLSQAPLLIYFHFFPKVFFPIFELPNSRCGLSASAAYTPVFTVKQNQIKPNQTKPNETKPNKTKHQNETKSNQTKQNVKQVTYTIYNSIKIILTPLDLWRDLSSDLIPLSKFSTVTRKIGLIVQCEKVICETKQNKMKSVLCKMKICTLRNENVYFGKRKSVLCETEKFCICEMKIWKSVLSWKPQTHKT